jgi:hypothetical protein
MMERFMWILADEAYYFQGESVDDNDQKEEEEAKVIRNNLPPLEWFKLNR